MQRLHWLTVVSYVWLAILAAAIVIVLLYPY